ncbi:MAG TPA: helical backbone metal receptor [Chitinophagaceae bacterium]|nr:helical backbone metal receptor [Chitinophagaceae bacterium]
MANFTDQVGRTISVSQIPQRIISLVPSQTELLYDLGLRREVAGITKFCVHPEEWFHSKPKVGGTKKLKNELIRQLQPDLVLANKEENVKEQIEELEKDYPVWISDVGDLPAAYDMIGQVGGITGKKQEALQMIGIIQDRFKELAVTISQYPVYTVIYMVWQNPYMSVGGDSFIHSILEAAGFKNMLEYKNRYPVLTIEEIQSLQPEFLFLSSEPFPFANRHLTTLKPLLPRTKIVLVDGELFSWYGSRLLKAPAYLKELRESIK